MCVLCNWWVPNRVSFRYGCSKQSSGHGQAVHISRSSSLLAQLPGSPPAVEKDSLELLDFILFCPQSWQEEHSSSLNSSAWVLELMMTGLTWIICPPINPLLWAERYHTMIGTGRGHVPALESGVADASHNSDPKNWEGMVGLPPKMWVFYSEGGMEPRYIKTMDPTIFISLLMLFAFTPVYFPLPTL